MNAHERDEYDHLLDGDEPQPCPVCTGDETAPPCSEECEALIVRSARVKRIRGWYAQARRALRLARIYRRECTVLGADHDERRERACLDVVQGCRIHIKLARAAARIERAA